MNDKSSGWKPVSQLAIDVGSGKTSAQELVEKSLSQIEKHQDLGAVISTLKDTALTKAKELDKKVSAGKEVGPLAGVPFITKDNFLTVDGKTTAGAKYLKGYQALYQSTAIRKLENAGAICVAKSNLDAWAHGSSTENSDFFVTKNPHDQNRVAGGSSGGSAAAVALDMAPFALGTDTGGSVRLPASFCGVFGYKPTYGLISRSGIVAMASSTDVVGTMAKRADDVAAAVDVMAGKDPLDSTTIERDAKGYEQSSTGYSLKGKKIGIIKEYMSEGVEPGVDKVISESIAKLKKSGAHLEEISLPSLPLALAVYYIICPAEVSSNLARYDGQRYGYNSSDADTLEESYLKSREQGFGAEAKRRIMIGAHVLSSGYYDAYYKKAQTVRTKIINEFNKAFESLDLLIGPTSPTVAFKIGERMDDPLKMYLSDILMVAANISGNPSISVPAGETSGLPVGLQILACQSSDRELLAAATAFGGLS